MLRRKRPGFEGNGIGEMMCGFEDGFTGLLHPILLITTSTTLTTYYKNYN